MKRSFKLFLALTLLVPHVIGSGWSVRAASEINPVVENAMQTLDVGGDNSESSTLDGAARMQGFETDDTIDNQAAIAYSILTGTLTGPLGMQGFDGDYAIDDPNEVIEIIVQFVTPPAVALRLMQEKEIPIPLNRAFSETSFEEQALSAHAIFEEQLNQLPMPFNTAQLEVFAEHHRLFNGVYMRVPGRMVASIAALPEVYAVFPNIAYEASSPEGVGMRSARFQNPNFMRATRELLNMDYIHNEMGITGAGVRVAILDTGIYHNHPEFARFLDETGRVPGWQHFDNSPSSDPAHTMRFHGTPVSGAAVAIAPNMELWHYRIALTNSGGGLSSIAAIELAHADGMDVMNMSFVTTGINHPFTATAGPINLAVLDGVIMVGGAGNSGSNWYTAFNPGTLPLVITVGNSAAGRTNLTPSSSRGPVALTYHIKPDIVAPGLVFTTSMGGGYNSYYGTSLSAPVITGVAALLREANPDATPQEIRAMMMNTANPLANMNPNRVFAVGAGFVDPLAALSSQDLVTVHHYIPLSFNAPWVMGTMASLSFGDVNHLLNDHVNRQAITTTIRNNHHTTRTYTIDYYFANNPNNMGTLSFNRRSIEIGTNQTGTFTTTMSLRTGFVPEGFYEGYIYVRSGGEVVARLPFGLVNTSDITFQRCEVIAEGRFANQAGMNGIAGSPWILCADGTLEVDEGFINWTESLSPWHAYRANINRIIFTGGITAGTSLRGLFHSLSNVTTIEGLNYFDTSRVTNMSNMFFNTNRLTSLDVSSWDTSNVIDMSWMFVHTHQLASLDVSNWDTSSVRNMNAMFGDARGLTSIDVSSWDTSNVTNMSNMFGSTFQLTSLDLSTWDTSNVTNMSNMFSGTFELTSLDLSTWDTSNVTNMSGMFVNAVQLTSLDVSTWDTGSVTNMGGMFAGAGRLKSVDVSNWDTSSVTEMGGMFAVTLQLTSLDLSTWDTSSVTSMHQMFFGANQLTSLDLANWDTRNVTNMNDMFMGTSSLRNLTLGEYFEFRGTPNLPTIRRTADFTGYWQNVGSGTVNNPAGTRVFTSEQLMSQFNGRTMADTFVWQPIR